MLQIGSRNGETFTYLPCIVRVVLTRRAMARTPRVLYGKLGQHLTFLNPTYSHTNLTKFKFIQQWTFLRRFGNPVNYVVTPIGNPGPLSLGQYLPVTPVTKEDPISLCT